MSIAAMKQALEALEMLAKWEHPASNITTKTGRIYPQRIAAGAADALRTAIEKAEKQEPVAWMDGYRNIYSLEEKAAGCEDAAIPLVPAIQHWSDCAVHNEPAYPKGDCDCGGYTTPPAAQRQPLTDEELNTLSYGSYHLVDRNAFKEIARAIEAAHGITGEKK